MTSGWTDLDVPDQTGRLAIVTGSTSGIGLETARVLARKGAHVIVAARNEPKAEKVIEELVDEQPNAQLEFSHVDVSSLESVRSFADRFMARDQPLDLLINNAGIMMVPHSLTVDGFESHLGTNHLGHFALTGLLLPALEQTGGARVVTVSSIAHKEADIDFADLHFEGGVGYSPMRAYRRSKLANLLFAVELDRRLQSAGSGVSSVAAHPGVSDTNLAEHLSDRFWWKFARPIVSAIIQGSRQGALATLRAATDPQVLGGEYFGPGQWGETTGRPILAARSTLAQDEAIASQLWESSELLTGISFP